MFNDSLSKKFEEVTGVKFNTFYHNHKPKLIWYLTKYTKDQDLSEDFADEAFMQALLKIDNFDAEKSQIHTWIYKIAENFVKKEYKENQKLNVVSIDKPNDDNLSLSGIISDSLIDDDSVHEEELIMKRKVELVKEAIEKLPNKYKHVMMLREIEGKAYLEIADICTKTYKINVNDKCIKLQDPTEFLELELTSISENNVVTFKYIENNIENIISFDIKQNESLKFDRDLVSNVIDIEILSFGEISGVYKTTTNLSTIKSQISKGRQLIQSMVYDKFKNIDEHGLI